MKRSSNRIGSRARCAAAMVAGIACFGAALAAAQTLGQQVSPQPMGGDSNSPPAGQSTSGAGQSAAYPSAYPGTAGGAYGSLSGYGQQPPSVPMNLPGTGPMNSGQVGQFGTGIDIPQTSPSATVGTGDLLDVVIFDTPDLSGRFRINQKGDILLPLLGNLHVAGLTVVEITDLITNRYKDGQILVDPQVTVFVAEYTRRTITITGEVRAPNVYQVSAARTLTDTLAMAGGLNDSASRTVSIVHASDPDNIIHVTLNVAAQTPESVQQGRMQILPGDTIFVARSGVVYIVGEMQRPGGFQVEHNDRLSLLEAVALAGGPTRYAKTTDTRLIRRSATGREELKINLKKVLFGGGPDMLLTDGDILYVPTSLRKQYTFQALDATVGGATSYGIYRIGNL